MTKNSNGKRRFRIPRPSAGVILGGLALIVALGGVAHSAVPSPTGQIHACYLIDPDPDFSYVYVVDHDVNCQTGEERIQWSQEGADQAKVAAAEDGALKIDVASIGTQIEEVTALLSRLSTPKVSGIPKSALKAFDKKEAKGLSSGLNKLKKNDREIAREIKKMREVMSKYNTLGSLLQKNQVDQKDIILQAIRAVKAGL